MRAPVFHALTRPVSFMGLPMTYVAFLMMAVVGGFILTQSFVYFIASGIILYSGLRALAAYDPNIIDVFLKTVRATPITLNEMKGKGVRYEPLGEQYSLALRELVASGDKRESLAKNLPYIAGVRDDVMILRDGDLMVSLEFQGLGAATERQGLLDDISGLMAGLIAQYGEDFGYSVQRISTKASPRIEPVSEEQKFAHTVDETWSEYIQNAELRDRVILFSITLRPSKIVGFWNKLKRISEEERKEKLNKRIARINGLANAIEESFSEAKPVRLTLSSGRWLGLLRAALTGEYAPIKKPKYFAPLNDLIGTTPVSFDGDQFTVFGHSSASTKYSAIFTIKKHPGATDTGILDALDLAVDMTVTNSFTPENALKVQDRMRLIIRRMNVAEDAARSLQEDLEEALDDVASGREGFGDHQCTIAIYADSPELLDDQVAIVSRILGNAGISAVREGFGARAAYFSQAAGNYYYRGRSVWVSATNFGHYASLHGAEKGFGKDKSLWGDAVTLLPTANGETYRFNFHLPANGPDDRTVGHTLVLGKTGSGKTLGTVFLLAQSMRLKPRIIVFDKDNGMEVPMRALGGKYSPVKMGQSTGFNPFAIETDERGQAWLTDWLETLLKPENGELNPTQIKALSEAARANGNAPAQLQNIENFASQLVSTDDEGDLVERFSRWQRGGQMGWLFDGVGLDSLDFTNNVTCFDVTEIFDNDKARTAWLSYVFRRIERTVEDERPTIIVLDEAWKLLDDPYFEVRLKDWMLTMRKKNVIVVMLTQRVSHITESRAGGAILESVATRIIYPNSELRPDEIRPLGLTDSEEGFLMQSNAGHYLALVTSGGKSSVVDFDLSGLGSLLKVLGGGKGERYTPGWRENETFWQEL